MLDAASNAFISILAPCLILVLKENPSIRSVWKAKSRLLFLRRFISVNWCQATFCFCGFYTKHEGQACCCSRLPPTSLITGVSKICCKLSESSSLPMPPRTAASNLFPTATHMTECEYSFRDTPSIRDVSRSVSRYINLAMDNVPVSFSHASGNNNSVRLSGLPFRATEKDIKDFFKVCFYVLNLKSTVGTRSHLDSGLGSAYLAFRCLSLKGRSKLGGPKQPNFVP